MQSVYSTDPAERPEQNGGLVWTNMCKGLMGIYADNNNNNNNNNNNKTCNLVDFALPADHRVKIKESDKTDKYLDLDRGP